ncbi:MAG: hypothetical protein QG588_1074, partial [Candidatus Poribacteria bacterium]|nr:hypothetical protein [Candidatus Poribacteria bacterium]
ISQSFEIGSINLRMSFKAEKIKDNTISVNNQRK